MTNTTSMSDTLEAYKWFKANMDAQSGETAALVTVAHMLSELADEIHNQWMNDADSSITLAIERAARALEASAA